MRGARLLLLSTIIAGCAANAVPRNSRASFVGLAFEHPPIYTLWFQEAHNCVLQMKWALGDSAGFTVDSLPVNLNAMTWIAVPTERWDGRFFIGMHEGDSLLVSGLTAPTADSMWLSSPVMGIKRFVKHEAMHVFVHSPGEYVMGDHGIPWGHCEYQ